MKTYFKINTLYKLGVKEVIILTLNLFLFSNTIAAPLQLNKKSPSIVKAKYVEGEILVRFKSNVVMQAQQSLVANHGGLSVKSVSRKMNLSKVMLQPGDDITVTIEAYKSNPNIEHVQPNYIYSATALPNDTNMNQLWGMRNTGANPISNPSYPTSDSGTFGSDIDAESAWDQITDCRSTVVAVLDTGINYTHQDLAANMWDGSSLGFPKHGYDFIDNDNDPMPTGGGEDHGTHVAGTIGAVGNNSLGVTGVCWQANIMSVRVLGATGGGTTASIIQGIEFAADKGAKVINMSLGGESALDFLFNAAITYAQARDVVVVVAAGNGGSDGVSDDNDGLGDDNNGATFTYPCNFTQSNLLCVAALDQSYSLASFSNYGSTSVDVGAPGTNVLSSWAGNIITDDFTGWTLTGGWASGVCSSFSILSNPSNYCSSATGYANNIYEKAYKSFNLNGALAAELSYYAQFDTELNTDYFITNMKSIGGDPFSGGSYLDILSGSTLGYLNYFKYDISSCNTSSCSIGFALNSDATNNDIGIGIVLFNINTLEANSSNYNVINGTSMASPHVAGIATMIRAFNPNYTYTQTVEAIKNGGETIAALSGKTTTGKAANAMGSLAYITQPSGVVAVVQ